MKASLLLLAAVLSVTAANAAPRKPVVPAVADEHNRCNVNLWPGLSAVPCRPPPGVTTYGECSRLVRERGWGPGESWWYCSSVHFKS
jgi:hypothetical protein